MERMTLKIIGTGPILMHSDRTVNTFDPLTREIKKLTDKKKKTDDDLNEIARLTWEAGLYFDDDLGPYLPGKAVKAAMISGGKKHKLGSQIKGGVVVMTDKAPLEYAGPRTIAKLWKDGRFADVRSVVVSGRRVMRCRPMFPAGWSATFEIVFDKTAIDPEDVFKALETAGAVIGIGDYRPEKSGDFGRFNVEVLK